MKKLLFIFLLLPIFACAQGIKVGGPFIKVNPADNTITGYAHLINGANTSVATKAGLDSILTQYSALKRTGMEMYVVSTDTTYRLQANSTWLAVSSGNIITSLNNKVSKTGDESIAGIKSFSSSPLMPTPSTTDRSTKGANMAAVYALSKSIADSSANYNTTQLFTATKTSSDSVVVAPNATILTVSRGGASYYYANSTSPTGNAFYYNGGTGSIKFQDAFNPNGERVAVTYRGSRTIAGTIYYGPSSGIPTTVGDLSALTSASLATTFISNTGTTYRYFSLVMNQAYTISQVQNLDAGAFGNITSNYIFRGTIVISSITYNVYTMITGTPYSTNNRHQFTIN